MKRPLIKLLPAPHEARFSQLVADYLLRDGCIHLGLELPREVEARVNGYVRGENSCDGLMAFLLAADVISPYFEPGFRPIFQALPELYRRNRDFTVHCYEELDIYNDWVFSRDELVVALLRGDDFAPISALYRELLKETRRRNAAIAERLGALARDLGHLHVVIGRLHAPEVSCRLAENFDLRVVVLEDIYLTPLDESLILCLKGFNFSDAELASFLDRHRRFALEAEGMNREISDLLRDEEAGRRFQLKKYTELATV